MTAPSPTNSGPDPAADGDRGPVERLAAIIADGGAIDWDGPEVQELTESERRSLRAMEVMRRMSAGVGAGIAVEAPADPLDIDSVDEADYEVLGALGEGSHGRVYRAIDRALHRTVALKVVKDDEFVDRDALRRFLSEARILASLDHENIVRIYSIDRQEGRLRLSLEHVEGRTLKDVVSEDGPRSPAEVVRIGVQLCRALAEIHAADLLHGDVKPSNIMLTDAGRVVLLDFGIARRIAKDGEAATAISGTPVVMAPEQLDGEVVDARADLFAIGAVLYYALCGRYPFEGGTLDEIRARVQYGPAVPVEHMASPVPARLAAIVARATERAAADRFDDAAQMGAALSALLPESMRQVRRQVLLRVLCAALLVAAALVSYLWTRPTPIEVDLRMMTQRQDEIVNLHDGDNVLRDDALYCDVTVDRDCYLYLFNEDGDGWVSLMYPAPGEVARVTAGVNRLPPPDAVGEERFWFVETYGQATEYFLCVASKEPIDDVEALARRIREQANQVARVTDDLRGVGQAKPIEDPARLVSSTEVPRSGSTELGRLRQRLAGRVGVQCLFFSLRHPPRGFDQR